MKIRTLTDIEKRILREALSTAELRPKDEWAAEIMIDMIDDLLWIESKEEPCST